MPYSTLRATRCVKSPTVRVEKIFPDKFLFAEKTCTKATLLNFAEHYLINRKDLTLYRQSKLGIKQCNMSPIEGLLTILRGCPD